MKLFKKLICLSLCLLCTPAAFSLPAAAQEEYIKGMDKGYITFIFDDNRSCTRELFELFSKYNMPLSCAVIAQQVENSTAMQQTLMDIQNAGGEILSHTYTHKTITADNYDAAMVEEQFSKSYNTLTGLGFNVNGIIETGNGGGENTAPKDKIEAITKKYFKYSDDYGVSPQYKKSRTWLSQGLSAIKKAVDKTATNKSWTILSAHDFGEMPKAQLEHLLQYISENDNLEVVTWNYMYRTFGTNPEKITPTGKANNSVTTPTDKTPETDPPTDKTPSGSTPTDKTPSDTPDKTPDNTPNDTDGNTDTDKNTNTNTNSNTNTNTNNDTDTDAADTDAKGSNVYTVIIIIAAVAVLLIAATVVAVILINKKS